MASVTDLSLLVATTSLCLRDLCGPAWPCLASIAVPKISGPAGHKQRHAHSDSSQNAPGDTTPAGVAVGRDAPGHAPCHEPYQTPSRA